jgi:N-acetylglutamate synthase-like GNAT family acetyltransferase
MTNVRDDNLNPRGNISLRPAEPADEPFLLRVYAAERAPELTLLSWGNEQKQAFVQMQFAAQHEHYHTHFPDAQFQVICLDGKPVGRLYLARLATDFRIMDIAVLPENRNAGIATSLIKDILRDARSAGLPVTVCVETYNPSVKLFVDLGFRPIQQDEFNFVMQWSPASEEAEAAGT